MKWLRILLTVILISENVLIPFSLVKADEETEPVVEISYTTKDTYTPKAEEYVTQVNNAAVNGKTYNFYTLSGVLKTVKAMEKGTDKKYFHTGDGVPGYVILSYDKINGQSLSYKDWIAATTTNENGKFAIPIEKTKSGVYLVVLRPIEDNKFRFITSYDVSSSMIERARVYPENGLNIGVIEKVDELKDITEYVEDLPDSVKIWDDEEYWSCGDDRSSFKYKHPEYSRETQFDLKLTDGHYQGNIIPLEGEDSLDSILNGNDSELVPTHAQELYEDEAVVGRNDRLATRNYTGVMSALSFFNGVLNRFQPTSDAYSAPNCTEFLNTKYDKTGDYNKNYYTYNGMSALMLPNTTKDKVEMGEIDRSILESTVACAETDGTEKTFADLIDEGYEGLFQNFMQAEDFEKYITSRKFQDKIDNDSVENKESEGQAEEFSRVTPFDGTEPSDGNRGERMAALNADQMIPKENETKRIFSDTLTAEGEGGPYKTFEVPYIQGKRYPIQIYELGPLKGLCEITEVVKDGEEMIKNEVRLTHSLTDMDEVAAGYALSNTSMGETYVGPPIFDFFGDPITMSIFNFLSDLITTFAAWVSPSEPAAPTTCLSRVEDSSEKVSESTCDTLKSTYGDLACEGPIGTGTTDASGAEIVEYYKYNEFEYTCEGDGQYKINAIAEQIDEGNIEMKGNTPNQNTENIREAMRIDVGWGGEIPLSIGKGAAEIFEATNAGGSPKLFIDRDIDNAATDTLDYSRFAATLPDGTQNKPMEYKPVLVRLIDRQVRDGNSTSSNIYAGTSGGGGGTGGGTSVDIDADCAPAGSLTYFNQTQGSWASYQWGPDCTMLNTGCGPTSAAMIINKVNGMNPYGVATSYYPGEDAGCDGTADTQAASAFQAAGLSASAIGTCNAEDIKSALCDGNKLVMLGAESCSTSDCSSTIKHWMLVVGTSQTDNAFIMMDPYYSSNTSQKLDNSKNGLGTPLYYTGSGYICVMIDATNIPH